MNPPARMGGDRLNGPVPCLGRISAAADDEGRYAAFLRSQLQAPALGEVEHSHFTDDCDQTTATQGFLDRPERVLIAPRVQIKKASGIAVTGRKRAGVEIALTRNPESMAKAGMLGAAQEARRHCGGKARFFQIGACAGEFMECPQTEAPAGQMPVNSVDTPGKDGCCCFLSERRSRAFQKRDPALEGAKPRSGIG